MFEKKLIVVMTMVLPVLGRAESPRPQAVVANEKTQAAGLPTSRPTSRPASRPASLPVVGAPVSQPSAKAPASLPSAKSTAKPMRRAGVDVDLADLQRALAADRAQDEKENRSAATKSTSTVGRAHQRVSQFLQSMNPNLALITDVALAIHSDDSPPMIGGHDPSKNGFNLQQVELAIGATVDPYFRFDANIVFAEFGVEIEEAYATTMSLPWNLQVRLGQFLTRFGRINATHPHTWDFVDQTLIVGKFFGGEGNRGLGAEVSVLLPLPWYVLVVGSVQNATGASTNRSFYGATDLGIRSPLDFQYVLAAKQFFPVSDNWSVFWGLSGAFGPNPTGRANRSMVLGTDLYLKYRPIDRQSQTTVALQVEWMARARQVSADNLFDHGLYAYLLWRINKSWGTALRYEYVSGADNDYLDPEWTGTRHRLSANGTFWPTEFSRIRLQYNYDKPNWLDGIHSGILAFEFSIGPHRAHQF